MPMRTEGAVCQSDALSWRWEDHASPAEASVWCSDGVFWYSDDQLLSSEDLARRLDGQLSHTEAMFWRLDGQLLLKTALPNAFSTLLTALPLLFGSN